jgi:hypothetical protein
LPAEGTDAMPYGFDLLELNGQDIRTLPLFDRKARLAKLLACSRSGSEAAVGVRDAAATLARATQLAAEAKGRLMGLDVDGAILAHATAAYSAFAENSGERPAVDIPAHLAERREACDAAKRELAAAQAAEAELADERAAALREHKRRVAEAAAPGRCPDRRDVAPGLRPLCADNRGRPTRRGTILQ